MSKRGFTLIELLAAIIILGIVSVIAFPIVNDTLIEQKTKLYKRQVATIEDASKSWSAKNASLMPDGNNDITYVSIDYLLSSGFIENKTIDDPTNSEELKGCVKISFSNNQYVYKFLNINDEFADKPICQQSIDGKTYCVSKNGTSSCH